MDQDVGVATHIMLQTTAMQVQYHDLMAPTKQPLLHFFHALLFSNVFVFHAHPAQITEFHQNSVTSSIYGNQHQQGKDAQI